MTSYRLGESQAAREYYDRAVARAEKTYPLEPPNVFFRKEASELMASHEPTG